jgi:hypothetical protein
LNVLNEQQHFVQEVQIVQTVPTVAFRAYLCLIGFRRFLRRRPAEAQAAGENQAVGVQCTAAV